MILTAEQKLEAFLNALAQLDKALPPEPQKQLNEIGNTLAVDIDAGIEKMDDFGREYAPLAPLYQAERIKFQEEAA